VCSKHYDMWVFKIPRRAFAILAYAGIHFLQRVSLWIPAFAGMTGSGSCQPSPGAFVILANAGIHSLQLVSLDSRIRGNDGQWQSPTVAYASGSDFRVSASVFFRVIPWLILLLLFLYQ